VFKELI